MLLDPSGVDGNTDGGLGCRPPATERHSVRIRFSVIVVRGALITIVRQCLFLAVFTGMYLSKALLPAGWTREPAPMGASIWMEVEFSSASLPPEVCS